MSICIAGLKISFLSNTEFYSIVKDTTRHYKTFRLRKRSGGYRCIQAPNIGLSILQKMILEHILYANYMPPKNCTGFIRNKNITDNVRPHLNNPYVFKTDIKDFFSSIKEHLVKQLFLDLGFDSQTSKVLSRICCLYGVLPQGAATSPMISNMIFLDLDKAIQHYCSGRNYIYTRYADDITISSNEMIDKSICDDIDNILKIHNLTINKKKTHLYGPGAKKIITGISIASGQMKIPRLYKRQLRYEINALKTKKYNFDEAMLLSLNGKLCYCRQIEPDSNFVNRALKLVKVELVRLKRQNKVEQDTLSKWRGSSPKIGGVW